MINFNTRHAPTELINNLVKAGQPPLPVEGKRLLEPGFQPGPFDVICARGDAVKKHLGNIRFLQIIDQNMQKYSEAASRLEKSIIVSSVIESIRESSPGGGFVGEDAGNWYEVGDQVAREKVGQRFRDGLSSQYRSSSRTKRRRRRANEAMLMDKVDEIVMRSKDGTNLVGRINELMSAGGTKKSEDEVQLIFDRANCELLKKLKDEEASRSSQKRKFWEGERDESSDESFCEPTSMSESSFYEPLSFSDLSELRDLRFVIHCVQ
jgi:hypothetical protein